MPPISRRGTLTGAAALGVGAPLLAACGTDNIAPAASGTRLGPISDVPEGGGTIYPAEKVVVTQPVAGQFKGFSSICTHQGCPVTQVTDTIDCTCHGSRFALTDGSVVAGPATRALDPVKVAVDGDTLTLA